MSFPINNRTTADGWTDNATLKAVQVCTRVNIDVNNNPVYLQFSRPNPSGALEWGAEVYMPPTFRALDRKFNAVRARSAVPGKPAQITIVGLTPEDIGE